MSNKSLFKTEQEANEYKDKHQLFGRVAGPVRGTGKWALIFPLKTHVTVVPAAPLIEQLLELSVESPGLLRSSKK